MLQAKGAIVTYNDPHIPSLPLMRHHSLRMDSQPLAPEFLAEQDCVLIVTDHSAYDWDLVVENTRLVVDTRNATVDCATPRARIVKA
jgi:UDP-N-acetyl-D-glucosamine dehydrogenase